MGINIISPSNISKCPDLMASNDGHFEGETDLMAEESRGSAVCHMEPVSGGQRKWTARFSARLLPYTIFRSKLTAYLL